MSKIIDLTNMQKSQEDFLQFLKNKSNMINSENKFSITRGQTLAILSELVQAILESKTHKWWDLDQVDRKKLLERFVDVFNHISNVSTQLEIKLIVTKDIEPIENLEGHFLNMISNIIQLSFIKKYFAKRKIELIFYQYIQLVYKLDFNIEQLEQAYYKKLEKNYKRFNNQLDPMSELKDALGELYKEFGHTEVTQKLSEILDEYILIQQREKLECYNREKQP